ncbi:hypothetical protein [Candidatus Endomicrobiellum agilis]|uniref:hypothetical protein n=1 Tax=Candidatus Endomicrobiellum agilis TaxID=3238957 RepID=UPI0035898A1B|nr:hypothetical protein [Endomicrobium sp.]
MKKVISLLLAVILISGCNGPLNKSKVETAKTGIQNAKQPNPSSSPSPSPSPSPSLTPKPTTATSPTETAMPLPSGQSALWWPPSQWSATTTAIAIGSIIAVALVVFGVCKYCGYCCFKKSNSDKLGDDKTLKTPNKKETTESSDPLHSTTEKNASGSSADEKKKKTAPPKKVKKSAEEEDKKDKKDKKEKSDEKSDGK